MFAMFAVIGGLERGCESTCQLSMTLQQETDIIQPFPGTKISEVKLSITPGRSLLSINKPQETGEMVCLYL